MTEEQRDKFHELCFEYRLAYSQHVHSEYLKLRNYVETLIDEAVKDAINAQNSDKTE